MEKQQPLTPTDTEDGRNLHCKEQLTHIVWNFPQAPVLSNTVGGYK